MTALEQALRTALLHFVWQGVLVAFVLWIALFLMRRRSANARYLVSCLALLALMALPVITAAMVYTQPSAQQRSARLLANVPRAVAAAWTGSVATSGTWMETNWLATMGGWMLPAWALGVILFSIRLAWGSRQVSLLRRSGKPADGPVLAMAQAIAARMGLARPIRI